ncbi:DUF1963 domain-containing protein [Muricauda sp. CAU 1633]|uniref:DUF1963 domain-containing protein n=1 Tax=Allomuricauda sp. CAU 1633 TaxID=2816036 RepID=UPI001A8D2923|nr:DUF1963 domain-containing protein [Muricauda sp. CAU 1633]MBO0321273.1 DUF1963 domain-containing protein [Muricauda sp. CAU 1633]
MNLHEKAFKIAHSFLKEHNLEDNWNVLKHDFQYYLGYNKNPILDESKVTLGASKIRGLPHLPDSFEFLPGELFIAQLNLSDIKPYDFNNILPEKGILHLFLDESTSLSRCSYYDGSFENLKVRPYPKQKTKLYDKKEFLNESYTIDFTDNEIVNLGKNNFEKILGNKFKDLTARLKEQLGNALVINDLLYCDGTPNNFVFGEPRFYQDEYIEMEYDEMDDGYPSYSSSYTLLFCMSYGEGHVNFFIKGDVLDISKDINNQIVAIYSGT